MVKKLGLLLLIMGTLFSCFGCAKTEPEPQVSVIDQRREAAEQYMRAMANFMWRAEEDITYTRSVQILTDEDLAAYEGNELMQIKKGRLYRGIPYSYTGASAWNFYDFTSQPDAQGISTLQGVHWRMLNGGSSIGAVLGNDCSSAIQLAWNYVGANIQLTNTPFMVPMYGYLRVGEYISSDNQQQNTPDFCTQNGPEVMAKAYSLLQKADAVVKRIPSYGHTMMIVENHPVYKDDATLDLENSYVTVVHQTSSYMKKEAKVYDEKYGEDVYIIYGIDDKYTYAKLFEQGYLPITCNVFQDPAPVPEFYVKDTETEYSYDNILKGKFVSNRILSAVTITIRDESGKVVMEGTCYERRQTKQPVFSFDLERFITQMPEQQRGRIAPEELPAGNYHCTHTLRDAHGNTYTMRDFDFTVS
jgi:hypothetical protein